jgi:hypothetical protein
MGDWMFAPEDYMHRVEAHRDRFVFDNILPHYERWRIPLDATADKPSA